MKSFTSMGLRHEQNVLSILDQTLLPAREQWIEVHSPEEMVQHIRRLAVRGAPLIGVAAAAASPNLPKTGVRRENWLNAAHALRAARPTAVNLMAAIDRLLQIAEAEKMEAEKMEAEKIVSEAEAIFDEDVALCEAMANAGAEFINDGDSVSHIAMPEPSPQWALEPPSA